MAGEVDGRPRVRSGPEGRDERRASLVSGRTLPFIQQPAVPSTPRADVDLPGPAAAPPSQEEMLPVVQDHRKPSRPPPPLDAELPTPIGGSRVPEPISLDSELPDAGDLHDLPVARDDDQGAGSARGGGVIELDLPDGYEEWEAELAEAQERGVAAVREVGIDVEVVSVSPGPIITRFELDPAPGVKVSQISKVAEDLGRSLVFKRAYRRGYSRQVFHRPRDPQRTQGTRDSRRNIEVQGL